MANHNPNIVFPANPSATVNTARPASPTTQRAFTEAARHANVFPPATTIHAASSVDRPFGATSMTAPPLVELNRQAHGGPTPAAQEARAAQTALHELVVHAQHDIATQANGAPYESAEQQHRRMFDRQERMDPQAYLAATRRHVRAAAPDVARQREIIADYHRDVETEISDPANTAGMSPQAVQGARTWARNRRDSMTDAILPVPTKAHTW